MSPRQPKGLTRKQWLHLAMLMLAANWNGLQPASNASETGKVSVDDPRRIPWAPRVAVQNREVAFLVEEKDCTVSVQLEFRVENFKLQQDGDVLYRYEEHSHMKEGQLGRGLILCGMEGKTKFGKPVFNCSLEMKFFAIQLLRPVSDFTVGASSSDQEAQGVCTVMTEGTCSIHSDEAVRRVLNEMKVGTLRFQGRRIATTYDRLTIVTAYASMNGARGPPSCVLSDTAAWAKCRGPLSGKDCKEDKWELSEPFPQWIVLDLGSKCNITALFLDWGLNYATSYDIQVQEASDSRSWISVTKLRKQSGARSQNSSMHVVHVVDLRKKKGPEIIRPEGVNTRFLRIVIKKGKVGSVSLWRVMAFGRRPSKVLRPNHETHPMELYLVDKVGNELGVFARVTIQIIDPRPVCTFLYLVQGVMLNLDNPPNRNADCVLRLATGSDSIADDSVLQLHGASPAKARNRLYEEVKRRKINYLYLIFMDSDAVLRMRDSPDVDTSSRAWDSFESELLNQKPAVGCPVLPGSKANQNTSMHAACAAAPPGPWVAALHHESVPLLVPFSLEFDGISPWLSGAIQNWMSSAFYAGSIRQFNGLVVTTSSARKPTESMFSVRDWQQALAWLMPGIIGLKALERINLEDPFGSSPLGPEEHGNQGSYIPTICSAASPDCAPTGYDICHPYFRMRDCLRMSNPRCTTANDDTSASLAVSQMRLLQALAAELRQLRKEVTLVK